MKKKLPQSMSAKKKNMHIFSSRISIQCFNHNMSNNLECSILLKKKDQAEDISYFLTF